MASPAYVIGGGLVTALGRGLPAHARALREGRSLPRQSPVKFLQQPLPFFFASDAPREGAFLGMVELAIADALADAGLPPDAVSRLGLFVGSTSLDLPLLEPRYTREFAAGHPPVIQEPGYNTVANEVARRFGLAGPQYVFSSACSSSANALLYARAMLAEGRIDHALVLGCEGYTRLALLGFAAMMLLTRGIYRPFDAARDGMILGEGAAAIVLSREPARNGLALVGAASACDPTSPTGSTAPRVAEVMRGALADAGLDRSAIVAVKAHGTGTPGNDLAEGLALRNVFADAVPPLTSLKPYLGHTLGGSGAIELLALLAAWREGFLPATPGFAAPDPELGLSPLTAPRALPAGPVLCNCFGFGGNNTSLVVAR